MTVDSVATLGVVQPELAERKCDAELEALFTGAWRLNGVGGHGTVVDRLGDNPTGLLIYDGCGNMSVQIMDSRHDRVPLSTDADFKRAVQGYIGYFGKYLIDRSKKTVIHHVIGSIYAPDIGRDFYRSFKFNNDSLILTAVGQIGGEHINAQLHWERANPETR